MVNVYESDSVSFESEDTDISLLEMPSIEKIVLIF